MQHPALPSLARVVAPKSPRIRRVLQKSSVAMLAKHLLQAPLVVALCVLFYLTINGAMDWLAREIRLAATRLLAMRRFRWLAPVVRTPFVRVPAISAAITLPILSAVTTLLFFIILPLVLAEKAGARDARRLKERLAKGVDVSAFPKVRASQGMRLPGDARLVYAQAVLLAHPPT